MKFLRKFACPACQSAMTITSSHQNAACFREQYAVCSNKLCCASFLIRSEVSKLVSPPAPLFADNVRHLPVMSLEDNLIDYAVEFVQQNFSSTVSRNALVVSCCEYLVGLSEEVTSKVAQMTAARAVAFVDSRFCTGWSVSVDDCSFSSVVLSDLDGNKHVISLRELVRLITPSKQAQLPFEEGQEVVCVC